MSFKKYTSSQQAILTTLLYSDIFSFPLKKDEFWFFLISNKKVTSQGFDRGLNSLKKLIVYKSGFYCLKGREEIITRRRKNYPEFEQKMRRALWVTQKLSRIPSLLFVGISGGLAVGNVTKDDDIDLVVIVKENTLFMSRFLVLIALEIIGVRRSRNQQYTSDTICVNLLFDETALGWFAKHKDMYTAREIGQIVALFDRNNTYKRFIHANKWIGEFLPNVVSSEVDFNHPGKRSAPRIKRFWTSQNDGFGVKLLINPFFEKFSRWLQLSIIKRHRTNEIIENHILAFHPNDYRIKTLKQLRLKMRQFGLLTKN